MSGVLTIENEQDTANEGLAERVRALRVSRGLSQAELAELVGVTPNQVHLVESGKTRKLQRQTLRAYAEQLGATPDYIRFGSGPGPNATREDSPLWTEGQHPPIDVYLRQTSNLGEAEIVQVARIVRLLEEEQRRLIEEEGQPSDEND